MEKREQLLRTLEDFDVEATAFVEALEPSARGATLITLSGELGAGKTTFAQAIARALGVEGPVTSPTFVIEKIYGLPEGKRFERLVHIDAYRLSAMAELNAIGFGTMMSSPGNLILLEWPERVVGVAELATLQIVIEALPNGSRQITYA
jgi:tRNA threonylcarbamoyladenosine biosynthesis protein TsaE